MFKLDVGRKVEGEKRVEFSTAVSSNLPNKLRVKGLNSKSAVEKLNVCFFYPYTEGETNYLNATNLKLGLAWLAG